MPTLHTSIPGCAEHERLEFELLEVRTRGRYLGRLRALSRTELSEWDRREQAALLRLALHESEHGCGR
jgi:hypothetical protein